MIAIVSLLKSDNRKLYMGTPTTLLDSALRDSERSVTRSILTWKYHKRMCGRVGFSPVTAVFLVFSEVLPEPIANMVKLKPSKGLLMSAKEI